MKKVFAICSIALSVLFAASCNKALDTAEDAAESLYTLEFNADDAATKAYTDGDGSLAKVLEYRIYIKQGSEFVATQIYDKITVDRYPYRVQLRLANNMTYRIACFAQSAEAEQAGLYDTSDLDAITLDYTHLAANDDMGDAFCATREFVPAATMLSVVMHRPLAQINVCTGDLADYNRSALSNAADQVVLKFHDVTAGFGIVSGNAAQDGYVPAHMLAARQDKTFETNVMLYTRRIGFIDFTQVTSNFLLASLAGDMTTLDLTFKAQDGTVINTLSVTNVPYRSNYRTNIFGNMLTDVVGFSIDLSPLFEQPDYNRNIAW